MANIKFISAVTRDMGEQANSKKSPLTRSVHKSLRWVFLEKWVPAIITAVQRHEEFHAKYKTATIDQLPQDDEVEARLNSIVDATRKDLESRAKIFSWRRR